MRDRFDLEKALAAWRRSLAHNAAFLADDVEELERHVRDQVEGLVRGGLSQEAAFARAMAEMGGYGAVEDEYRKVYWGKRRRRGEVVDRLRSGASMLKSYGKATFRTLRRQKTYTLVNVAGLGLGLAAFLVIGSYVSFEFSFDRFFEGAERIYRIRHDAYRGGVLEAQHATTFGGLAGAVAESVPEVAAVTSFYSAEGTVSQGALVFNEKQILFADAAFFRVFSYALRAGTPETALAEPDAVVLTASAARKYFGTADPMGRILHVRQNISGLDATARVTGVVDDPPTASHLQFDLVFSMRTWWNSERWGAPRHWRGPDVYTYVALRKGAAPEVVAARLSALVRRYAGGALGRADAAAELSLQPITDIRRASALQGELGVTGTGGTVWTLAGVGVFVLVIAWVNYVNLATARSMQRAREVSLRKVVGARRSDLAVQFLVEGLTVTLLAAAVALLLVHLGRPYLPEGFPAIGGTAAAEAPAVWLVGLAFVGTGTLLAALYPALVLSAFPPALVLKGAWSRPGWSKTLRSGLIAFQFAASASMIAAAVTVWAQMDYVRERDLGFDPRQVLIVNTADNRAADEAFNASDRAFRAELLRLPAIEGVTLSSSIPGETIGWITPAVRREGAAPQTGRGYRTLEVEPGFLDQFGLVLVAGTARRPASSSSVTPCLLNEAAVQALGFASAEAAVGGRFVSERPARTFVHEVQGVVRDFHQRSLHEAYEPIILRFPDPRAPAESATRYALRVGTQDLARTIERVEALYKAHFPGNAFEYFFLDDFFDAQYEADRRFGALLGMFTLLAAVLSFLGLYGLTSFTAAQRTKEIGIRKAMGASVAGIFRLLAGELIKLVGVGVTVGLPVAYMAIGHWLDGFVYRIVPGWWFVLVPCIAVLGIALFAVSYQSLRAALADPVDSLRYE